MIVTLEGTSISLAVWKPAWSQINTACTGVFLGLTGLILIADLEHPARFPLIFTRPQWRSWLVRGGVAISAYGLVLAAHFFGSLTRNHALQRALLWPGLALAVVAAGYTAYLFAQSKARDLWQNPLLPVQLLVQATLAGAAALVMVASRMQPDRVPALARVTVAAVALQLALVAAEATLAHPTAHAKLASREMTSGRYGSFFWAGLVLMAGGLAATWLWPAAILPLAGLLLYEHAYVQAGQAVPLA